MSDLLTYMIERMKNLGNPYSEIGNRVNRPRQMDFRDIEKFNSENQKSDSDDSLNNTDIDPIKNQTKVMQSLSGAPRNLNLLSPTRRNNVEIPTRVDALRQQRLQSLQGINQILRSNYSNLNSNIGSEGSSSTGLGVESGEHQRVTGENGRLDTNQLTQIAPGHYLQPDAASAYMRMASAAAADGVTITTTDSYRDYATQVRLAEEKGLYSQGGLAAVPGTSNHGWGLAIDVGRGAQRDWLAKNGEKFGFYTIPREPWHWEFRG